MALKTYAITYTDDTAADRVAPTFADSIAFEAHLRAHPRLGKLQDNIILSTGYRCWSALHRAGKTTTPWPEFSARIADIELIENDDAADEDDFDLDGSGAVVGKPTQPAA